MKWRGLIGLKYKKRDDPNLTISEAKLILDTFDFNFDVTKYKTIESLISKEILYISQNEFNEKEIKFTEEGQKFRESLYLRLYILPNLKDVGALLETERLRLKLSRKHIAEKSGTNISVIGDIEHNHGCFLDDLRKVAAALRIELDSLFDSLNIKDGDKTLKKYKEISENTSSFVLHKNELNTESPIEEMLLEQFLYWKNYTEHLSRLKIETQKDINVNDNVYRVDFLITLPTMNKLHRVIIECDGHDFHEKTKEQAQKDKKRDRDFLSIGIPTIRFTGSEVYNDSKKCAFEAISIFYKYIRTAI